MSRQIYYLKVILEDVTPRVWRRIATPGAHTLDRVHRAIGFAMGWQDCHLHSFEIDSVQYGEPDPDELMDLRDEMDVRLDAVATKDSQLRYVYDFGDWWEHRVTVEEVLAPETGVRYPYCLDGAGACPPEDVGGPAGFANFLEAMRDPAHPDHHQMLEWHGRAYDPRAFDAERATVMMRRMA